jgi:flagellar secretion chaperone FliS
VTYDPTATYRTAQVTTSSPVAQVVLLYEGALRFAAQSAVRLEQHDLEGAHNASIRAQAIISALRESLDLSAGDVALHLDGLYSYMCRRLVEGNLAKDPAPAREVIGLLRELLAAWRAVVESSMPRSEPVAIARSVPPAVPSHSRAAVSGAA